MLEKYNKYKNGEAAVLVAFAATLIILGTLYYIVGPNISYTDSSAGSVTNIEVILDDYLLTVERHYYYGEYTENVRLVYSTDEEIQDSLIINGLTIEYNSNKNEIILDKDNNVTIYTTSKPRLEDKLALEHFENQGE